MRWIHFLAPCVIAGTTRNPTKAYCSPPQIRDPRCFQVIMKELFTVYHNFADECLKFNGEQHRIYYYPTNATLRKNYG